MNAKKEKTSRAIRFNFGIWVSSIAATLSAAGTALTFVYSYEPLLAQIGQIAGEAGVQLITYLFPILTDVGIFGAALWTTAFLGFVSSRQWSLHFSLAGCLVCMVTGFFPSIPMMRFGLAPTSLVLVFLPNVLFFFLLTRRVHRTNAWDVTMSFLCCIAMIFAVINGIASTHHALDGRGLLYVFVNRLLFLVALGWGVAAYCFILRKRPSIGFAVFTACWALFLGIPLAALDALTEDRFSAFALLPLQSLIILFILFLRRLKWTR